MKDLIHSLENAGEVGVTIAMHDIDGNKVSRSKPGCFVLDPPKEKTLQKKAIFFCNVFFIHQVQGVSQKYPFVFNYLACRWPLFSHLEPVSIWRKCGPLQT